MIPKETNELFFNSGKRDKSAYPSTENRRPNKCREAWVSMRKRCYDSSYHNKFPTYIGCSIHPDWYDYQVFAKWYYTNYKEDHHIDKDIRVIENKVYSEDTCLFVPSAINSLFIDSKAIRGKFPVGVTYHKKTGKYQVNVHKKTGNFYVGSFDDLEAATKAYKEEKLRYAESVLAEYEDLRELVIKALRLKLDY